MSSQYSQQVLILAHGSIFLRLKFVSLLKIILPVAGARRLTILLFVFNVGALINYNCRCKGALIRKKMGVGRVK